VSTEPGAGQLKVLGGNCNGFKVTGCGKSSRIVSRLIRRFRYGHLREQPPHKLSLDRIIVEKNQGVQAKREFLSSSAMALILLALSFQLA
jgi:hypothetical protein